MNTWNGLDFFIFLILTLNTILGLSRGASKELISLMCLSAALIFAIVFTVPLANFFNSSPLVNDVVNNNITKNFMAAISMGPLTEDLLFQVMYSISLLICFVGVFSLCEAGLSVVGFSEVFSFPYAALNRKVGGSLGFMRGYIICLLFLSILALHLYKAGSGGSNFLSNSFFAKLFQTQYQLFDNFISSQKPEDYQKLYQNQPYNEKNVYDILGNPQPQMPQQPQPQQFQPQQPQPQQPQPQQPQPQQFQPQQFQPQQPQQQ